MNAPAQLQIISEETLIAGMLNNDQGCFSEIYNAYAARLYGLIIKWVKEKEKAAMLLHGAFVKAWQNRNLFDAKTEQLFCWLCRLARICYNENRAT
jgi:DNA-directed RNA polymerase specialized sigma24 family protein